ncbi:reverse transcriptase domain-containing protein [Tanacetum coccineum]
MNTYSYARVQSWVRPHDKANGSSLYMRMKSPLLLALVQDPIHYPAQILRQELSSDLPIIAEKVHQEKVQQDKLKPVKARLNFEESSRHSESGTPSRRRNLKERLRPRHARSRSESPEPRRGHSKSPKQRGPERKTVFKRLEKGVFHRLGDKENFVIIKSQIPTKRVCPHTREIQGIDHLTVAAETLKVTTRALAPEEQISLLRNIVTKECPHETRKHYQKVKAVQEDIGSQDQRDKSRVWRTTSPNHGHIKTYDGSEDLEVHLKIFQAAAKTERWAMPTWCHMFNSTLAGNARVWFDDLPQESIDSYDDLRKAFLENYLQQKKCIKDPLEIHKIKQKDGESTKELVRRYKLECEDVKRAPECMKISGFMHGITNPELIKRLHDKIPKSVDEMMRVTTVFLRGEVVASNHERKKSFPSWKQQEAKQKFTLLTKTPKEILALDKGKFKPPPSMITLVEKRNASKFCEFHGEVWHTTDEYMHLKRQIEMLKAGKLSHLIKELKQSNGKDQAKAAKKGETSGKDKPLPILMVQPCEKVARQKITQFFSPESVISFLLLGEENRTEGPMIIEAEMGGHCVHRMYVDGGSSLEILYEHCFNKFRPEVKNQMIPAATPLVGFSGEIIWPLGKISLFVKIGDEEHSTSAWMNFMVVRSPSPFNGIIGRPRVRRIQAVPSTAHGILKFPITGGTITLRSSRIIPLECTMVSEPGTPQPVIDQVKEETIQVSIHPEYPEQTIVIGSMLTEEGRKELCGLLRRNLDIFSWRPADMTGVPRYIAEHRLNIKVEKLVEAGIMKRLAVKPSNGKKARRQLENGTFLGYKVDADGLRVCPDKVEAVLSLSSPRCLKDVQKLNGKLASVNQFLSKSAEESLPFFKTLKCTKKSDFQWTAKAEAAFKQMKKLIAELPMLTAPKEKEELIMYLAAAKEAISAVLMTKRDGKKMPIYFVSRALQGPEVNYTPMKKLILALLEEHDIHYRPRTSVKGHVFAYFIIERPEEDPIDTQMDDKEELLDPWVLFTDGSSCVDGSGAGLIITYPEGVEFTYALRFRFNATNNEAEYEALIAGLRIAEQMGVKNLQANVDSKLVANQVNGVYVAKEPGMIKYLEKVKNLAASKYLYKNSRKKSIDEKEVVAVVEEEGHTWMTPIYEYLTEEILPEEKSKARAIRHKAGRYVMSNGILYKKSFLRPWLRCEGPLQENYVLREIHEGSCSMHAGPRSVVAKSLRSGYYWPTMHADARKLIRECSSCQVHSLVSRNPQQKLTPITSLWLFHKWGIDIAGPFLEGPGKVKFLIVAMDYFTKWIEAKLVATITGAQVKKFVWDNIVCRFGLPREIISDNRKQFRDNPFKDWCEKLCIRQCFASVKHPQANGLVERENRSLGEGIKARLGERSKNWLEEISHVLWAHRTMIKTSNEETSFSLTYDTEAVIPVEIGMPTLRTVEVDMIKNNEALEVNLDLLEERREHAAIQEAKKQS